jgi:hypothetical protein
MWPAGFENAMVLEFQGECKVSSSSYQDNHVK